MAEKILESVQRARAVRKLSSVATQVARKTAEGFTVYVSTAVHKVKHGKETLEFDALMEMDESDLRPQQVGGIFYTKDPEVIDRIESLNPRIYTERFEPQEPQKSKEAFAAFAASVDRRGPDADQVALESPIAPPEAGEVDKAALLANAGKKGQA